MLALTAQLMKMSVRIETQSWDIELNSDKLSSYLDLSCVVKGYTGVTLVFVCFCCFLLLPI